MPTLTPAQEQVIALLASGSTFSAAAQAANIHRNTIAHWRRTIPAFAQALAAAQYDRLLHWRDLAEEHAALAISTIRDLMADPHTPAGIRLKAALALLKECTTLPPAPPANAVLTGTAGDLVAGASPSPSPTETANRAPAREQPALHNPAQSRIDNPADSPATVRRAAPKTGRNELCPCGSNQKYKRCCLVRSPGEYLAHAA